MCATLNLHFEISVRFYDTSLLRQSDFRIRSSQSNSSNKGVTRMRASMSHSCCEQFIVLIFCEIHPTHLIVMCCWVKSLFLYNWHHNISTRQMPSNTRIEIQYILDIL